MRPSRIIAIISLLLTFSFHAEAQDLPQPSPKAKVEQRIGLTDVSVTYSRPGKKGRDIWGALVPYGEVWRAGANEATVVDFSDDVTIKGNKLPPGSYALFITPMESGAWKVHFNTATDSWGSSGYKPENDVVVVELSPKSGLEVESMRFTFENLSEYNHGDLVMDWAGKSLSIPIEVEVQEKAWTNIKLALEEAAADRKWIVLRNGANYAVQTGERLEQGLDWIEESIDLKESWYSYWVKADIQKGLNKKKDAIKSLETAIKLGEKSAKANDTEFTYKAQLEELIEELK